MRLLRSLAAAAVAIFGGIALASCGFPDIFRPAGLKDVVVRYVGDSVLSTGQRVAPAVTVTAGGAPVPTLRLRFASSDTTVLALTAIGDTLVACRSGHVELTIRLISSMVTDTAPAGRDSIHITGGGPPMQTCP